MDQPTTRVLAHLLDFRGTFEGARAKGHIQPDAPGASPDEARLARDRSWTAFEKILKHNPLTQAEMEAARETLEWYRAVPEGSQLPLDDAETLLEGWQTALESPDLNGLHQTQWKIYERWLDKDAVEELPDRARPPSRSNGNRVGPRAIPGEDVSFELEEAYEQARAGFSELASLIGDGDTERALYVTTPTAGAASTTCGSLVTSG